MLELADAKLLRRRGEEAYPRPPIRSGKVEGALLPLRPVEPGFIRSDASLYVLDQTAEGPMDHTGVILMLQSLVLTLNGVGTRRLKEYGDGVTSIMYSLL